MHDSATRLAAFVDGYGADRELREALPRTMVLRAAAMHDLLRRSHESGRQPWGTMYVTGHGDHWAGTRTFVDEHLDDWRRALAR
ncbi:hypothetical protein [Streptomyces sp. NPDC057340]|uniref:hypothetical protein n=1 Tax=Streptomyces sp. NPDC057340 TaxID=3346103 RepID=UPI003638757C